MLDLDNMINGEPVELCMMAEHHTHKCMTAGCTGSFICFGMKGRIGYCVTCLGERTRGMNPGQRLLMGDVVRDACCETGEKRNEKIGTVRGTLRFKAGEGK